MAKRPTKAFYLAKCTMLETDVARLMAENAKLRREVAQLRDQLAVHGRVPQLSFQVLQAKARALAEQGVPCKIVHGHIVHSITGAPLL